jgi:hypothetical protein
MSSVRPRPRHTARPPHPSRRSQVRASPIGATSLLALLAAVGLILVALGNNAAREESGGAELLYWLGLVLIYAPITFRLLSTSASRTERVSLSVLLGVSLFLVRILYSPTVSSPYDELATWRQTADLINTGHAFTNNPIAAGYPAFPGLELVSAAVAQLAGVSIFHAGLIVIGTARAVLMLALFLFLERVTGSARAAGIGIALYACNPSFLYFDSQFHHEPMALALGAALLLVVLRWTSRTSRRNDPGLLFGIAALAAATTLTHHMMSYALALFLLVWTAAVAVAGKRRGAVNAKEPATVSDAPWLQMGVSGPALPAAIVTLVPAAWFIFVAGGDTVEELGGVLTGAIEGLVNLVFGGDEPKALFQGEGPTNSFAARLVAIASVITLLGVIAAGFLRIWRRPQAPTIWWVLAATATLYPATLAVRLTQAGTETAQRASAFVFVGMAFLTALLFGPMRWPRKRLERRALAAGLAALATIIFIGGVIIGKLPATRQPGPFLIGADARSIGPQGHAAAQFAKHHLPPESRILVDRSNSTLLGSYGGVNPVQGQIDGIPVARVLFNRNFGETERFVIEENDIDYVVTDRRLSSDLPVLGFYFEPDEPGAATRRSPLSARSLAKFRRVRELSQIYSNGPISIYDSTSVRSRGR